MPKSTCQLQKGHLLICWQAISNFLFTETLIKGFLELDDLEQIFLFFFFFSRCWNAILDTSCGVFLICLKSMLRGVETVVLLSDICYAVILPMNSAVLSSSCLPKPYSHVPSYSQFIPLHLVCLRKEYKHQTCLAGPVKFGFGSFSRELQHFGIKQLPSFGAAGRPLAV